MKEMCVYADIHPAEILLRGERIWRFSPGKSEIERFHVLNGYVALV